MLWINVELGSGKIKNLIAEAIELSKKLDVGISLSPYGVPINVDANSDAEVVYQEYKIALTK